MFIASSHSRAHIVHDEHCPYARRIVKSNQTYWYLQEDALKDGHHLCAHCSAISKAYKEERIQIEIYASSHEMIVSWDDHLLKIHTPHSDWILAPHEKESISLFHKNTFQPLYRPKRPTFEGYHYQKIHRRTVLNYLKYISHHDRYRKEHPIKTPLDSSLPQLKHGVHYSHGKKKQVKQLKRRQHISRVKFLLSQL